MRSKGRSKEGEGGERIEGRGVMREERVVSKEAGLMSSMKGEEGKYVLQWRGSQCALHMMGWFVVPK